METSQPSIDFVASFSAHRQTLLHHAAAILPTEGGAVPDASRLSKLSQTLLASLELLKVAEEELAEERRRNEASSSAAEKRIARLRVLFDRAPSALLLTATDTSIREVNRAAGAILNQDPHRLEGRSLQSLVPAAQAAAFRKELAQVIEMSSVAAWSFTLERRGNFPIPVTASVEVIDDEILGPRALYWNIRPSNV